MSYVPLLSPNKFLEFFNKRISIKNNPAAVAAFKELRTQLMKVNSDEMEKGRDPLFLAEVSHINHIVDPDIDTAYLRG